MDRFRLSIMLQNGYKNDCFYLDFLLNIFGIYYSITIYYYLYKSFKRDKKNKHSSLQRR